MANQNMSKPYPQNAKSTDSKTGDFAHELNNLLTAIISNISIAKMDIAAESEVSGALSEAEGAADEAKQLLSKFAGSNEGELALESRKDIETYQEIPTVSRKILVLDDEARAGTAMCRLVEHLGHDAEYVADSDKALALYRTAKPPFDLVILDLLLQGDTGATEVLKRLNAYDPDVKAVLTSGHLNSPIVANFSDFGFRALIKKPYRFAELQQVLNQLFSESN